jgi:hypothetical protein
VRDLEGNLTTGIESVTLGVEAYAQAKGAELGDVTRRKVLEKEKSYI